MNDAFLLDSFSKGFIPGPDESDQAFKHRVSSLSSLSAQKSNEWEEVSGVTKPLFGFILNWLPVSYSNRRIAPWEGAVTRISKEGCVSIQLSKKFKNHSFWGYHRRELLAHEAVHVARMRFKEPFFEETLAYLTALRKWRRFWGPIFTFAWEPPLLLTLSFLTYIIPWLPILGGIIWTGWLLFRQITLKKCISRAPLGWVLCLTDREIMRFAWRPQSFTCSCSTPRERLMNLLKKGPLLGL